MNKMKIAAIFGSTLSLTVSELAITGTNVQASIKGVNESSSKYWNYGSWWENSSFNANSVSDKVVSGDFNGDGLTDIAGFYTAGAGVTEIRVWTSNGSQFNDYQTWWTSKGKGSYDSTKVSGRIVSGDFDNDGVDDIAAFYDYGYMNAGAKIHTWLSSEINPLAKQIVDYSEKFLGTPYKWGGTSPETGFDCSGFTQYVYAHFEIYIPRTMEEQVQAGSEVSKSDLQPGDLVFFGNSDYVYHVGIYIGEGNFIHSPKIGDVIKISSLDSMKDFYCARRLLN